MGSALSPRLNNPGIPAHIFVSRLVAIAILLGVALTFFVSEWCLLILLFVSANLMQSTFSWGICPPLIVLGKLGWVKEDEEEPVVLKHRVYFLGKNIPETNVSEQPKQDQVAVDSNAVKS